MTEVQVLRAYAKSTLEYFQEFLTSRCVRQKIGLHDRIDSIKWPVEKEGAKLF